MKVHPDTAAESLALAIEDTRGSLSWGPGWREPDHLPSRQLYVLAGIGQALTEINETLQAVSESLQALVGAAEARPEPEPRRRFPGRRRP